MTDEQINPYEAPTGPLIDVPRREGRFAFWLAVLLTGGLAVLVLVSRRWFESIYAMYGESPRWPASVAVSPWTMLLIAALFLFTLAKEVVVKRKRLLRHLNLYICLAALVGCFLYFAAIITPLMTIVDEMTQ